MCTSTGPWWRVVVGAFAPRHCAGCDAVADVPLCARCEAEIRRLAQPPVTVRSTGTITVAYPYEPPVRGVIHRGKYGAEPAAIETLARLAASRLAASRLARDRPAHPAEVIIPVPLGRRRYRQRGYNQASLIARVLAGEMEIPVGEGLVRVRETRSQVDQDEIRRRESVDQAFRWMGVALGGARVLLVDDVRTTGATTEDATRALRSAGAGAVDVAVLAAVL